LFGPFLIEIPQLYLLLERFDLFVFADQLFELDASTDLLVLAALEFLAELILWDLEIDAVGGTALALVETG
jgi:hypothetical protein